MTRTQIIVEKNKRREQIRRDVQTWIFLLIMFILAILPLISLKIEDSRRDMIDINKGSQLYTTSSGKTYLVEIEEISE